MKQLLILLLLAGLLAPGLGAPARVLAQDDDSPNPDVPAAIDAGTDVVVDPAAVYEEPLPKSSIPGAKEVRLEAKESTYVASGLPDATLDGTRRLRVGYSEPNHQYAGRPLVRFDLGSIPRGAHVYIAQVELQVTSSEPPADPNQNTIDLVK